MTITFYFFSVTFFVIFKWRYTDIFPNLHNCYILENPAQVKFCTSWKWGVVSYICTHRGVQLKSEVRHTGA